eukprot:TRINITY_DN74383_c0_g1_i1.p1 TRINITY_DN74383_c0_g1~~TRINITY_DN74383_c0_g1_i1.p1  ORF type:complete len:672 (-),score=106.46 TRINITY_DN74383_c0_g1_i1:120-2135(-)
MHRGPSRTVELPPEDDLEAGSDPGLRRILRLAGPEWCWLCVGTILLFFSLAPMLVMPKYFGKVISTITDPKLDADAKMASTTKTLIELVVVVGLGSLATIGRAFIFNGGGERVVARLRIRLFKAIVQQEIGMFDKRKTGELLSRLSADTTEVQDAATTNISMFIRGTCQTLISFGLMFYTSWQLACLILLVIPPTAIIVSCYGRKLRLLATKASDALGVASDIAQQSVSNIRTVRSFAAEDIEACKYSEAVGDPDETENKKCCWYPAKESSYKAGMQRTVASAAFMGFVTFIGLGAITVVIWYGAYQVIHGQMDAGELITFILYSVQIGASLGMMSSLVATMYKAKGASKRTFQLIDREPRIPVSGGVQPENGMEGHISFDKVSFSYPTRADVDVLKNFSLEIPKDKTVAFVGHSGSGKSTVLALIQRFYDVTAGQILIDGTPLKVLDPRWVRGNFAYVQQEPVLFGDTIAQNIAYGHFVKQGSAHEVPDQVTLEKVAKDAFAHDFIMRFPEQYNTLVGERGVQLSGGQKQRIAIARALLINPRVLLLDEATSALDAESEAYVAEAISKAMVGRTTLIVAHRLSTVRNADMIVVMDNGCIIDQGTHEELLSRCTKYQELIRRQLRDDKGKVSQDEVESLKNSQTSLDVRPAVMDSSAGSRDSDSLASPLLK